MPTHIAVLKRTLDVREQFSKLNLCSDAQAHFAMLKLTSDAQEDL
jgi:hypothetical protein